MKAMRVAGMCVLVFLACGCSEQTAAPEPESQATATTAEPAVAPRTAAKGPVMPPPPAREVSEEELQPLRDAVARDLDDVAAQRALAHLLWEGGRYDDALKHFERAVQIDPNDPGALSDLGKAYEQLGRMDDAEGAYRRMATLPPYYHVALYELGKLAVRRGDPETAIRFYRQSIESKPDFIPSRYRLGLVYEEVGQYREAYGAYSEVLQLEPPDEAATALDYLDALYRMGKLDLKMGAVERAAEILAEVVATYPEHPEAHYDYGLALQALGRRDEADREFALHEQHRTAGPAP